MTLNHHGKIILTDKLSSTISFFRLIKIIYSRQEIIELTNDKKYPESAE